MAKGARGGKRGEGKFGGGGASTQPQTATNARFIENMNEAQIDREIAHTKKDIARADKIMENNDITNTAEAKAMREAFPLGVGGDGWSEQRRKAWDKRIERDTRKAKAYTDAYDDKKAAESRLSLLEKAKKEISGTGKTQKQLADEKSKKAVESSPKSLTWKTTQKGGWSNGGYSPKIIKAGNLEIHGSAGLYSLYKDGKLVGRTDKLSKAKTVAERLKQKG